MQPKKMLIAIFMALSEWKKYNPDSREQSPPLPQWQVALVKRYKDGYFVKGLER